MSNPRFQPRHFAVDGSLFGKSVLEWKPAESMSRQRQELLRAAQLQHLYAVRIRERARYKFGTVSKYAAACDASYDRLVKVLRGEAIMRIEDIAQADHVLSGIVTYRPLIDPRTGLPDEALRPEK